MKHLNLVKSTRHILLAAAILLAILVLTACPNAFLEVLQQQLDINFGQLGDTLTVQAATGGTITTPSSSPIDIEYGIPIAIEATPGVGYDFSGWIKLGGDGTVTFTNSGDASTNVTVEDAGVVIQATFTLKTYTLSAIVSDVTKGSISNPITPVTVTHGISRVIYASNPTARGWFFSGWTKSGGTGTATFANASNRSTNVTVTGGNVQIRANYSAISASLVYRGYYNLTSSAQSNERMDTPRDFVYDSGYLYVAGNHGSDPRVLKIDVSNPTNPSFNAINSMNSGTQARALISDGTNLFVAVGGYGIRRIALNNFTTDSGYNSGSSINRITYGGWFTEGDEIRKAYSYGVLDLEYEEGIYVDDIYYDDAYGVLYVSGTDYGGDDYLAVVDYNSSTDDIFLLGSAADNPIAVNDNIGAMVSAGDIYLYAAAGTDGFITYFIDDVPVSFQSKDGISTNTGADIVDIDSYGNYLVTAGVNGSYDKLAIWDAHWNNGSAEDPYYLSSRNSRYSTQDIKTIDMFGPYLYTLEGTYLVIYEFVSNTD